MSLLGMRCVCRTLCPSTHPHRGASRLQWRGLIYRATRTSIPIPTARTMATTITIPDDFQPRVSEGHDATKIRGDAAHLVSSQLKGPRNWTLTTDGRGIERVFRFKTFKATWEFMNEVAAKCKEQKHHPEWTNIYNKTHIRWTTHNPLGLSAKDITMAQFCDEAAGRLAEQEPTADQQEEDRRLFESRQMEAPDCCMKRTL